MVGSTYDNAGINSPTREVRGMGDYAAILAAFCLDYKSSEYYWQVGSPNTKCGWVLNLSVIKNQMVPLLKLIIPVLMEENIPFRVIRDESMADFAVNGNLGPLYLGKMASVFSPSPEEALIIAKKLISLTASFIGPEIRTDRHLGAIVYTSWAGHNTIPFSLPQGVSWPFMELATPQPTPKSKLLNFAYYPTSIIKPDAKGDVIKALYFKNLWKITTCVIKQGRQYMFMDDEGRDIRDRLLWQYELHSKLAADLPLPKLFDRFESEKDIYLAMQYINGVSLTSLLDREYKERVWHELPAPTQTELIDHLIKIIEIVQHLHDKGYIHRDITPENFLIDKNKRIWMIDVELMWSRHAGQPAPPFGLGTPGFISPEQRRGGIPTEKEDVYAVGALMTAFFTNLMPLKFLLLSGAQPKKNVLFFLRNKTIAAIINECVEADPSKRPDLPSIATALKSFRCEIHETAKNISPPQAKPEYLLDQEEIRKTIQLAINGLAEPFVLDSNKRWMSRMPIESKIMGNDQLGMVVEQGWYRGMSGPLWLLALANRLGFDTTRCEEVYEKNWISIQKRFFSKRNTDKSLYAGGAGIALALTEGFDSGLLLENPDLVQSLPQCYSKDSAILTLAEGLAGQGISILYASHWIYRSYREELLSTIIEKMTKTQLSNGSWDLSYIGGRANENTYGLNHGNAGIIWFLLVYLQNEPDPSASETCRKALNWLMKEGTKKRGRNSWPFPKNISKWSSEKGILGIALVLIKAYQVLKLDICRYKAESILSAIPEHPVITNFTMGSGLAGIGEIYLEASKVLNNLAWLHRAEWIVNLLLHTTNVEPGISLTWLTDYQPDSTADLFMGSSGIIHFLMRFALPDKLAHPLDIPKKLN